MGKTHVNRFLSPTVVHNNNNTNNMTTTHIISTDLVRPLADIRKDIEAMGGIITRTIESSGNIFVHIPQGLNAHAFARIAGIQAMSPDYPIKAS